MGSMSNAFSAKLSVGWMFSVCCRFSHEKGLKLASESCSPTGAGGTARIAREQKTAVRTVVFHSIKIRAVPPAPIGEQLSGANTSRNYTGIDGGGIFHSQVVFVPGRACRAKRMEECPQ